MDSSIAVCLKESVWVWEWLHMSILHTFLFFVKDKVTFFTFTFSCSSVCLVVADPTYVWRSHLSACLYRCVMRESFFFFLFGFWSTDKLCAAMHAHQMRVENLKQQPGVSMCAQYASFGSAVDYVCGEYLRVSGCVCQYVRMTDFLYHGPYTVCVCACCTMHLHICGSIYETPFDTIMLACTIRTYVLFDDMCMWRSVFRECALEQAVCLSIQARGSCWMPPVAEPSLPLACCGSK